MNSLARVAPVVNPSRVRLIFDSAELGCDQPRPFAAGLDDDDQGRIFEMMAAESEAMGRVERGWLL